MPFVCRLSSSAFRLSSLHPVSSLSRFCHFLSSLACRLSCLSSLINFSSPVSRLSPIQLDGGPERRRAGWLGMRRREPASLSETGRDSRRRAESILLLSPCPSGPARKQIIGVSDGRGRPYSCRSGRKPAVIGARQPPTSSDPCGPSSAGRPSRVGAPPSASFCAVHAAWPARFRRVICLGFWGGGREGAWPQVASGGRRRGGCRE